MNTSLLPVNVTEFKKEYKQNPLLPQSAPCGTLECMDRQALHDSIIALVRLSFARSGGKGGQNVNKVNTKVHAFIAVNSLLGLSDQERQQLKTKLASSINQDGELFVAVQDERTQERNREIALQRLESNIVSAARILPKRKKTKPSKAAKEKRLQGKRLNSLLKQQRSAKFNNSTE